MSIVLDLSQNDTSGSAVAQNWCYEEAFSRNQGILNAKEQLKLRHSHVAIAGMGGVGGSHLMTLVRLGIGHFTIADPDQFETANFNRQYGAKVNTIGRSKVEVMVEEALAVNPDLDIRVIPAAIDPANVAEFFEDADIFVDGVDFFAIEARRLVFREARQRGLWAITAGPHAFSAAWLTFSPSGMTFDNYFDLNDQMDEVDKVVAFAVGCVPSPIHLAYLNLAEYFQPGRGASLGLACQLASGIVATEVARILLGRPGSRPAPWYSQFDAHRGLLRKGRLWGGNRHPWQRLKRWWLRGRLQAGLPRA